MAECEAPTVASLQARIVELTNNYASKKEEYSSRLSALTQECEALRLENSRLKVVLLSFHGADSSRCSTPVGATHHPVPSRGRSRAGTGALLEDGGDSTTSFSTVHPQGGSPEVGGSRPVFVHNLVGLSHVPVDKAILHEAAPVALKRLDSAPGGLFSYFARTATAASTAPTRRERSSTAPQVSFTEEEGRSRTSSGVVAADIVPLASFIQGGPGEGSGSSTSTCSAAPSNASDGVSGVIEAAATGVVDAMAGAEEGGNGMSAASTTSSLLPALVSKPPSAFTTSKPSSSTTTTSGWGSWLSRVAAPSRPPPSSNPNLFPPPALRKRRRCNTTPPHSHALSRVVDCVGVLLDASSGELLEGLGGGATPCALDALGDSERRGRCGMHKPTLTLLAHAFLALPSIFSTLDPLERVCLSQHFKRVHLGCGEVVRGEGVIVVEGGELVLVQQQRGGAGSPSSSSPPLQRFPPKASLLFPLPTTTPSSPSSPSSSFSPSPSLMAASPVTLLFLPSSTLAKVTSLFTTARLLQSKHVGVGVGEGKHGVWGLPWGGFSSNSAAAGGVDPHKASLERLRLALDKATSLTSFCSALRRNLHCLQGLRLPTTTVPRGGSTGDLEQGYKDLERERSVIVQGKVWGLGSAERLQTFVAGLASLVRESVVCDWRYLEWVGTRGGGLEGVEGVSLRELLVAAITSDLLVGLSRTSHGGDSFSSIHSLVQREGVTILAAETSTQPSSEVLIKGLSATLCAVNTYRVLGVEGGGQEGNTPWALVRCVVREEMSYASSLVTQLPTAPFSLPSTSSSSSSSSSSASSSSSLGSGSSERDGVTGALSNFSSPSSTNPGSPTLPAAAASAFTTSTISGGGSAGAGAGGGNSNWLAKVAGLWTPSSKLSSSLPSQPSLPPPNSNPSTTTNSTSEGGGSEESGIGGGVITVPAAVVVEEARVVEEPDKRVGGEVEVEELGLDHLPFPPPSAPLPTVVLTLNRWMDCTVVFPNPCKS